MLISPDGIPRAPFREMTQSCHGVPAWLYGSSPCATAHCNCRATKVKVPSPGFTAPGHVDIVIQNSTLVIECWCVGAPKLCLQYYLKSYLISIARMNPNCVPPNLQCEFTVALIKCDCFTGLRSCSKLSINSISCRDCHAYSTHQPVHA